MAGQASARPARFLRRGRTAGRQHERSIDPQSLESGGCERGRIEEACVHSVGHHVGVLDAQETDRLTRGEGGHADHGVSPTGLRRRGGDGDRLVVELPGHDVVEGDDVGVRRRRQLEVHPVHDGTPWVEHPAQLAARAPGGARHEPHRQAVRSRQRRAHAAHDHAVHGPSGSEAAGGTRSHLLLVDLGPHRHRGGDVGNDQAGHGSLPPWRVGAHGFTVRPPHPRSRVPRDQGRGPSVRAQAVESRLDVPGHARDATHVARAAG